jgi:hypothetical protein
LPCLLWGGSEKGSGGPRSGPGTFPPLPPSGAIQPYAAAWLTTILVNQLRAHDNGLPDVAIAPAAPAAATAAPVRSLVATPDGRRRCKTAGTGFASRARNALHIPAAHSKKIRNRRLGADPRATGSRIRTPCPALENRRPGLGPSAAARRNDIGIAGSAPGVSPGRWPSVDTDGWPAFAATAAPRLGTRDYSTGPGDGWAGTTFHIP